MPGVVPPPSHSVVVLLNPFAEAPTWISAGANRRSKGSAAVMACKVHGEARLSVAGCPYCRSTTDIEIGHRTHQTGSHCCFHAAVATTGWLAALPLHAQGSCTDTWCTWAVCSTPGRPLRAMMHAAPIFLCDACMPHLWSKLASKGALKPQHASCLQSASNNTQLYAHHSYSHASGLLRSNETMNSIRHRCILVRHGVTSSKVIDTIPEVRNNSTAPLVSLAAFAPSQMHSTKQ